MSIQSFNRFVRERHAGLRRATPCGRGGFTLVEMMVVIVVIAILFAILMPAIGRLRQRAQRANADATAVTVRDAILQYHFEYGSWPVDYNNLSDDDQYRDDNYRVIDRLLSTHPDNTKDIPFLYIEDFVRDPESGNNTILDPRGRPYTIEIDVDNDKVEITHSL